MNPAEFRPRPIRLLSVALFLALAPAASPNDKIPGDVNADGIVNAVDSRLIVDHLLERSPLQGEALERADADRDGRVRMADAMFVNIRTTQSDVTIQLPGGIPLTLVRVPGGVFHMGSPDTERSRYPDEGPLHTVSLMYNFYMCKYEITQAQWLAVTDNWPGLMPIPALGAGDNHPAYYVSWKDTQNFISKLNNHVASTSQGPATFRLPSEAEWERACRGGTITRFFFGDSLTVDDLSTDGPAGGLPGQRSDYMWFGGNNPVDGTKIVGSKLPNAYGLFDMNGNLWEWTRDWYHESYNDAPTNGTAWESPEGVFRVIRGGHWQYNARDCRSAIRHTNIPNARNFLVGFRLVRIQ